MSEMNGDVRARRRTGGGVGARRWLWLCGLVVAAVGLAGAPASGISIDGRPSVGEWDGAQVVIWDPNETKYANDQYDVENIYLAGGPSLYMRVDVYSPPTVFDGLGTKAFMNFKFNMDTDPGATYCLTINDGFGFPAGELHLLRRVGAGPWVTQGLADYAVSTEPDGVFEAAVDWSLFPLGVIPGPGGHVCLSNYTWVFESGNSLPDDWNSGQILVRNDPIPVPMVPEPLTMATVFLGCAALAWRFRKREVDGTSRKGQV